MRPDFPQRGFGLVAALFVIVVIAAAIAVMARLALTQSATNSLALQQARAYQMAQAGLEWGIARAVAGQGCANAGMPQRLANQLWWHKALQRLCGRFGRGGVMISCHGGLRWNMTLRQPRLRGL